MTARGTECPSCNGTGVPVERITLKALLTGDALRRGVPAQPRYCAARECSVVYFDVDGPVPFMEADVTVPVYAKHPDEPTVPVCYCFGVTVAAMRDPESARTLRDMVATEAKSAHCACEVRNPKGACCLSDVVRIERGGARATTVSCCTTT
jgi:hypothetical protein